MEEEKYEKRFRTKKRLFLVAKVTLVPPSLPPEASREQPEGNKIGEKKKSEKKAGQSSPAQWSNAALRRPT